MNRTALRHILFVILTTVMCFGFSSYVLLAQYQVATTVSESNVNEEDAKTGEKSLMELNSFYLQDNLLLNILMSSERSQAFHHSNEQLPDFHLIPNTPPPNLV
ncbi:hypothetical protein FA048_05970 [Pedobacter polaris]|uniref:Uncharacterized protein n=1 Tax=Pedobacter polaris TaxID=2571273 RepID=A0A4U1CZD5_9SPHI|nr:hypothetical protein [Pedobacter polaris]TKC13159.1 hypothetical protein FA048_05970 [Pedobacter polaris]